MSKVSIWDRVSWGAIRQAKGITYAEIAEACGVYEGTPEKWFNNNSANRIPGLKHQITMAKVLGIPMNKALANISDPDVRAAIRSTLD